MGGVVAEFKIRADDFAFGEALRTDPSMEITLERIVPTGNSIMPYVWVRNGDFEQFERVVSEDPLVSELVMVDSHDTERLYRVNWTEEVESLTYGINASDGVILHASGKESWEYQIRFPDHDRLRTFYNHLQEHSIPLQLVRIYDPSERQSNGGTHILSPEQREALVLAQERGFFKVPRETSLVEIATELGISDQACSERLRRGTDRLISDLVY